MRLLAAALIAVGVVAGFQSYRQGWDFTSGSAPVVRPPQPGLSPR